MPPGSPPIFAPAVNPMRTLRTLWRAQPDAHQALRMRRFLLSTTASAGVLLALVTAHLGGAIASRPFWAAASLVVTVNLLFFLLFRLGINLRARDPSLTIYQMLAASATIFFVVHHAGPARHVFLLVILVILVFSVFRLKRQEMMTVVWFDLIAYALEIGVSLATAPARIDLQIEVAQWIVMAGALHLFALVTGQVADLRGRVQERNRELASAVAALQHKQEELAHTERLAMLGSWSRDIATGNLEWSDETHRLLGLNPAAGTPMAAATSRYLHPDDSARYLQVLAQSAASGEEFSIKFRAVRADGAIRWMTMHGYAQRGANGVVERQYGTMMDITSEMQGQLLLRMQLGITQVLAGARALQDAIPQVLQVFGESQDWATAACWRIAQDGASLRCVDTWSNGNPKLAGFLAFQREIRPKFPVTGGLLYEAWAAQGPVWRADVSQDPSFKRRAAALAAGLRGAFALPVISNGEALRVIEFYSFDVREPDAALINLAASLGDQIGQFIERRTAEAALLQSQERLDLALRASGLGLWEHNLRSGTLYASDRCAELLGLPPESMSRTWADMARRLHKDDAASVASRLLESVKGGTPFAIECRGLTGNGAYRWFLLRGGVFLDANGLALKTAGSIADIEDRKRLERAKDEFVATVSHELRTPLTAIRGALGLLHGGVAGELPVEAHELARVALTGAERLGRLVNDILDIARVESGAVRFDLVNLDVTAMVGDAVAANLGYAASFNLRIANHCQLAGVRIRVDADRIAQVMANLISNAIKFSPAEGVVEIAATVETHLVRISVIDHGCGVPESFRARMFQKFAQADGADNRAREGTGLGLSICRALMHEMHGTVEHCDTDGGGATFYIELPLLQPLAAGAATEQPAAAVLAAA